MNLMPTTFANFLQKEYHDKKYKKLVKEHGVVIRQLQLVQGASDISTNTDSTSNVAYRGTPSKYKNYSEQVVQLGKMYDNEAPWGCMVAKNVIDVRTAFSVGQGVQVKKRDNYKGSAEKELAWVKEFMRFNNLDEEMPQEYAKEAEIEGRMLLRFMIDMESQNIRVVHVPWRKFEYEIFTPDYDFYTYIRAVYTGAGTDVSFDMGREWFVYKRFGGTASMINKTPPKTTFILGQMEDLDKSVKDWRIINRLFSAPTPVITAPDVQSAHDIEAWIKKTNWKIGKALILGGLNVDFKLVGWTGDGYTTLKEESQALIKTISGTTGVPVHFLGYPELLSNRDTADNLIELIALSTNKERRTWVGAYEELFQKAMVLSNLAFGTSLDPMAINALIPFVTAAKIKVIRELFLPMYQQGAMSLQTLLSQISGEIDVDAETLRIKIQEAEKERKQKELANAAVSNSNNSGNESE